jgi:DNA-binding beta-propeller fold protein YncE
VVGAEFRDVGFSPRGVAVVGDRVWVISYRGTRVAALDAQSGERLGPQPRIGRGATSIAADRDAVWVTLPPRGYVVGIGPESGSLIRRITTPLPPFRVAVGRSGLWIAARETAEGPAVLLHYDRSGGTLLHQLDFPAGISALALGGGYAWVALAQASRIVRVSPDGMIEQGANLVAPAAALSYGAGHLWASALGDDSVARIDPRSKVAVTTAAGRHPVQLAVARGHVYVASNTNHRVLVLDAETGKRSAPPLRVAPNPFAVAAGGGHVWVTSVGTGTLTRLDPGA